MKPTFFKPASAFRTWLQKHHGIKDELWVGFYKKASRKKGTTYLRTPRSREDEFFRAQPPGYQKLLTFWVMSAKKDEARLRRLAALVKSSAEGVRMR